MTSWNVSQDSFPSFSLQIPILDTISSLSNSDAVSTLAREIARPLIGALQDVAQQDLITYVQTVQRLRSGEALKELEEYEEAAEVFKEVIKIQPRNYKAWLLRSVCLMLLGELEKADRSFDRTLEKKEAFEPYYYKALIFLFQNRPEDALTNIDRALDFREGQVSEVWHDKARILEKLNRFEESSDAYDKAVAARGSNKSAKINRSLLGDCKYKTADDFIQRANILLIQKEYEDSIVYIDRALEMSPDRRDLWELKGEIKRLSKEYIAAAQAYKKAISIQGESSNSYYGLGICFFKIERLKASSSAFVEALRLGHTESEIWLYYSLCQYKLGHWRKAISGFSKVSRNRPDSILGDLMTGHTFRKRRRFRRDPKMIERDDSNAIKSYIKVLKKRPDNLEAVLCLAKVYRQIDHEKLVQFYQENSKEIKFIGNYFCQTDLEISKSYYQRAIEISSGSAHLRSMVEEIEFELDQRNENRRRLEEKRIYEIQLARREEERRKQEECNQRKDRVREHLVSPNQNRGANVPKRHRKKWFGIF